MKKVLITGVTGFIGGRLAEIAFQHGISVVGLVRTWSRAIRLARLPVKIVGGDILNLNSLRNAMKDCDVVFHCAVDNRVGGKAHKYASKQGTANVMQTAVELGVKRVVHISSVAVFSYKPKPDAASEQGNYRYSGDAYCDGKIDAEKVALKYHKQFGLPVTVLRPTIVYGPFGDYTVDTINLIRQRRMKLIDGGTGTCNCLHVDNLVAAMLLAAEHEKAIGEVFHISDANPVTWKQFIEAHAKTLGNSYLPIPEISMTEIEAARKQQLKKHRTDVLNHMSRFLNDTELRNSLRSIPVIMGTVQTAKTIAKPFMPKPVDRLKQTKLTNSNNNEPESNLTLPLNKAQVKMYTIFGNITFHIDKARKLLGYEPNIDFTEGMKRTTEWINWARL